MPTTLRVLGNSIFQHPEGIALYDGGHLRWGLEKVGIMHYHEDMNTNQHIHILNLTLPTGEVWCRDCDIALRLATYDEAVWIQQTDGYAPDGPLLLNDNGVIVVPQTYSLYQEA